MAFGYDVMVVFGFAAAVMELDVVQTSQKISSISNTI